MKLYFAGADGNEIYTTILRKYDVKNKLESFYTIGNSPPTTDFESLLIDSGGFTARTRNVVIDVAKYAAFLNKYQIKLAFNLDTNNVEETLANQEYLNKHTATYIMPIYHMSDWIARNNLLDKFISDGFPYIALGGMAGVTNNKETMAKFLAHCFSKTRDKIKIHGLGMTNKKLLIKYPFYSVDSTSWLSAARYGNSVDKTDKRVTMYRVKSKHYLETTALEIGYWLKIEKDVTRIWNDRGIIWQS